MGSISKSFSLLLILILAVSILIRAKPAFAQTPTPPPIPTPSVPEFTVQPVGPSYTVPTTYSLNSTTGQVVAQIGYLVEYSYVVVTIKNQPYNSSYGSLYYNIQISKHDANSWTDLYQPYNPDIEGPGYPTQSDSDYTNISIPVNNGQNGYITIPPVGGQTDIQVKAMIGNVVRLSSGINNWAFEGETSGWSNTETVTLPATTHLSPTPTPSSSYTSTPTVTSVSSAPNSSLLLITTIALVAIVFLLVVIISLLLYMKKRRIA